MILLKLFWVFFKIGLFTIGGGYAMIPLIEQEVSANNWMNDEQLVNFFAISESTPGPFAINIATFIGFDQYGILGAIVAVIGVVLPSFIIILIIAQIAKKFINNKYVVYVLSGIRPVVVGLILVVGLNLLLTSINVKISTNFSFNAIDYRAILIAAVAFMLLRFKQTNKPILVIIISAGLGILLYSI